MARKSIMMPLLLAAAGCVGVFNTAFVGQKQPALRSSVMARQAGVYEVFVTASSVGMRTRMNVTPETTIDSIVEDARKSLGFDQSFLSSSDFNVYLKDDEDTPIKGKMGDMELKPWGPEGIELHVKYEPKA
uniref:Uncharacterized protein n=1 Tax=Heterocapsa rotundata TaxID=89963 RepID=A8I1X9_HETRO|nr:hypothetical protein [Heterocapsa rotundata]ABV72567.1 hypothetical protein [Heterocapsa rotundata]